MISPLRFHPIFKTALWGGRRLAGMFSNAPRDVPLAEAWLISDLDDNISVVADGPHEGASLRELMKSHRVELLGPALAHHESFPLLLKVIDTEKPLSVQVHPNDEQAQRLEGRPRGKTEAWLILHAEPGAKIYAGFKSGVDRLDVLRACESGQIEDTLHSFFPKPGDCVFLPAGTIHAVEGGISIVEVQQSSDITYRLFDWNRVDANTGQPRQLHVEKALECLDFERGPVNPANVPPGNLVERLASCEYFDLRRIRLNQELMLDPTTCQVLISLDGSAGIESAETKELTTLNKGNAVLLPPGRCTITPRRSLTALLCQFD